MNDKRQIKEEVKKTLESLDRIDQVAPKPFLFTRIMARMQQADRAAVRSAQPRYRLTLVLLAILVFINVVTVSLNFADSDERNQEEVYFEQYYSTLTTIDNLSQEITEPD